jgi:hypothetical protein
MFICVHHKEDISTNLVPTRDSNPQQALRTIKSAPCSQQLFRKSDRWESLEEDHAFNTDSTWRWQAPFLKWE